MSEPSKALILAKQKIDKVKNDFIKTGQKANKTPLLMFNILIYNREQPDNPIDINEILKP